MAFSPTTSYAAGTFASAKNTVLAQSATVLPQKIVIIGTFDPTKTSITAETLYQITSPEDAANKFGDGFMIHRLAKYAFKGSQGIPTYVVPQDEPGGGAQATGTIAFTASTVAAGTVYMYVAGEVVSFNVTASMTSDQVGAACEAAVTADTTLPVTASNTTGTVTFTAKTTGTYGNDIDLSFNLGFGQELPSGLSVVITPMAGGSGTPTIADALAVLGTGDDSNEAYFTKLIHGYLQDTTTLDAISSYNGTGNLYEGCYAREAGRPFVSLVGDTVATSDDGLVDLLALGGARLLDRTNGVIAVPDSQNHPAEIAALALGIMALTNNTRPEENYVDKVLPDIWPGSKAERWTSDYDNRNTAALAGISPTRVKNGVVVMQDVLSFYHPADVPLTSNGYKSMRNISVTQNILYNMKARIDQDRWKNITIVADKTKVTSAVSKLKVRDRDDMVTEMSSMTVDFEGLAWLFEAAYTVGQLNSDATLVTIRTDGRGFLVTLPLVYSGEGSIINLDALFDVSLALVL